MFISFGMFVTLIIVTIIMIILIIYLTLTSGKNDKSYHQNNYDPEKEAKARLAQNNHVASHSIPFESSDSAQKNNNGENVRFSQDPNSENATQDDPSLHVLPYPKDDDIN